MDDQVKTRQQLIDELMEMRRRVAELEANSQITDTSRTKHAEEALRQSEHMLMTILSTSPVAIGLTKGRIIQWVNDAWVKMFGFETESEYIGKDARILYPSEGDYHHVGLLYESLKKGLLAETDVRMKRKDGAVLDAHIRMSHFDPADHTRGTMAAISDISERKRMEEVLRQSEEKYRSVVENMQNVFYRLDMEGNVILVSPSGPRMMGYASVDEMIGLNVTEIFYKNPQDRERLLAILRERGKVTNYELELVRKDGTSITVSSNSHIYYDKSGEPLGTEGVLTDITERKRAEEALRESEEKYRLLVENANEAILVLQDAVAKFVNPVCEEIMGFPAEVLKSKPFLEFVHPDDREKTLQRHNQRLRGDRIGNRYPLRVIDKHGAVKWIEINTVPINWEGRLAALILATDTTERQLAEQALRESERKFRLVTETIQDVFWMATPGIGHMVYISPAYEKVWGRPTESLYESPQSFLEVVHPDDRQQLMSTLQTHHIDGTEYACEYRIVPTDDSVRWIHERGFPIRDDQGKLTLMCGVCTDITERRRAEEALKESEEWYRSIVEESFDGIFVQKGPEIIFANSRLYEMLGYSAGELEHVDHWLIYHPDYQEIVRERAKARMRGEIFSHEYEVTLQRKDGSHFEGEVNARAVTVEGRPGVRVWVRDVSKRKRLEEVQRRLATAIEQSADAIAITDAHGHVEYVNSAYERITGYTKEEVIGRTRSLFKEAGLKSEFEGKSSDSIAPSKGWSGRRVGQKKDGAFYDTDVTISPVRDPGGGIVNFVVSERDVTQEVRLQQQLLQAQKMEAVGTLAGGIAHDFNNLLTIVMGFAELLLGEKEQDHPDFADLHKILQAAKNGAQLVQRLLMFSRKSEPKPIPMNLNRQIVRVEKLLRRTIPRMIDIRLDLASDLPEINADPSQIEQVLINLAVNARDAMPDAGKLTVRTDIVNLDEEYCRLHVDVKPGEYVALEMSDTGHGMDKETFEHIFEPFFTTKEMGRGTGLGLAMVYGIVTQHNGHVTVHSELGKGTTFRVYLPAMPAHMGPDVEDSSILPASGSETVLLVDDEELVRELGARILTTHGYIVLQAEGAGEALDLFKKERSRISLVILDLIMPPMGGTECLNELLKIDPRVKVLVASGYPADASIRECMEMGAKGSVQKPFRVKELLREVRKVLDKTGSASQ